ncbi:MAG: triose-phosphate isomerase [Thiopseudomonas sp.]|nr:triose-phosphate isomerase [Thiopseudomonas sp.]MCK9466048.1 triose-phosphate isomerase [Thiopseudomonas sp.]
MRRPMVAGNWKMNGTLQSVADLLSALKGEKLPENIDVAVFPSLPHLQLAQQSLQDSKIQLGAQDCAVQLEEGALTGETSAMQLRDLNCGLVLVGHSERRELQSEDDQVICRKFIAAQAAGMTPILCVGETLAQREQGQAISTVAAQVDAVIAGAGVQALSKAVLAYEPVWAIGTGLTATPEQAQEVHAALREHIASYDAEIAQQLRILYGGSVKAANAVELFTQKDIDGGLIGGASLKADEFGAICRAAGN